MNPHLREQRRMAAQAFLESLERLSEHIATGPTAEVPSAAPNALTLDALEEAAMDIEHLFQGDKPRP